jgi:protein tyrosine/serine phosphatase
MNYPGALALRNSVLCKLTFKATLDATDITEINGIKVENIKVPKFGILEINKCYRGGQPSSKDLRQLAKLGVKTIINLRDFVVDKLPEDEQKIFLTDNAFKKYPKEIGKLILKYKKSEQPWYLELLKEKCTAERLGMKFVNIPMSTKIPPTKEKMEKFLEVTSNKSSGPIYLHCLHGRDRTGLMSAFYRIKKQNWSFDKATKEMMAKDYKALPGYVNFINYLFTNCMFR